jgi:septal ring factor EnvC (AmiA/AmiB activator)
MQRLPKRRSDKYVMPRVFFCFISLTQLQLQEANDSLSAKVEALASLERELQKLREVLENTEAAAASKDMKISELEAEKDTLQSQLEEAKSSLAKLESEHEEGRSLLRTIQIQVWSPKPNEADLLTVYLAAGRSQGFIHGSEGIG